MKSRLLNAGLCACALLMMLSACSSDETLTGDSNASVKSMKINVSDGAFTSVENSALKTRATDNEIATSFGSGDVIGIFVVKQDGTLALTNAKYTYDVTSKWLNSDNTDKLPYYDGAKYFAYYPYQESLTSDKYDAIKTTAETFFASLITGWTPAADQSTQANYTAQDLMVSMATVDASTGSCSFAMSHQMAMIEMDLAQYYYTYNGSSDTDRFTFNRRFTFNTVKPFNIADGKYRLLVNPSVTLSITGNNQYCSTDATKTKGWNISGPTPAVAKYKVYKYNGSSASISQTSRQGVYIGTANVGDCLYADGTTGTTTAGKTVVGIVFSNEISAVEYAAGYTHGYALALTDASGPGHPNWGPYGTNAGLTKVTTFAGYYNELSDGYIGTFTKNYNKSNGTYLAWQAANNYNVNVSGFTNSGWYLPSIGQWWDVVANLGKVDLRSLQTSTSSFGRVYPAGTSATNINAAITAAGGTALSFDIENGYYSASEYNTNSVAVVDFYKSFTSLLYAAKSGLNDTCCRTRAVLAF